MNKKTRVIMVGPKATVKGGITTVINGYKNDNQFNSSFLVKYYNSTISGNKIKKFFYCGWKLFLFPLFFLFFKPDIVHIHSSFGPSFTRKSLYLLISHYLGAKTIIHFHGADWGSFYESSSRKRRDRIKKILKRSDLVFALSQEWKTNFSKLVPSQKIRIIPNFVNFKSSDVKREHFYNSIKIVFLGEFCERKGCFDISKIIENVPEKERIKMIFAGFGDTSTLKKTFPSKSKNYEILGYTTGKAKIDLLNQCYILLFPTHNEGVPMSILEGMFFGIPCVLTNVGGIPSIFKNQISHVTLFEPYDFRGMSKEISKLINDKDYYLKLSSLNKKIAKNFSIRKSLGLVEASYKMLLNAK